MWDTEPWWDQLCRSQRVFRCTRWVRSSTEMTERIGVCGVCSGQTSEWCGVCSPCWRQHQCSNRRSRPGPCAVERLPKWTLELWALDSLLNPHWRRERLWGKAMERSWKAEWRTRQMKWWALSERIPAVITVYDASWRPLDLLFLQWAKTRLHACTHSSSLTWRRCLGRPPALLHPKVNTSKMFQRYHHHPPSSIHINYKFQPPVCSLTRPHSMQTVTPPSDAANFFLTLCSVKASDWWDVGLWQSSTLSCNNHQT